MLYVAVAKIKNIPEMSYTVDNFGTSVLNSK